MKEYELWLDESGDFEGETQANRRFVPSLAGGILIPREALKGLDLGKLVDPDGGGGHAMEMGYSDAQEIVPNALEAIVRRGGKLVYFENRERIDHHINRDLYMRVLASGLAQLVKYLSVQGDFSLTIIVALYMSSTADGKVLNPISPREYQAGLKQYITQEFDDMGFSLNPHTQIGLTILSARKEERLMLADYACNARLALNTRKYEPVRDRIAALFDSNYIFTMTVLSSNEVIRARLAQNDISGALMEYFTTRSKVSRKKMFSEIMNCLASLSYRLQRLALRQFSEQIRVYAARETDFERSEALLLSVIKGFFDQLPQWHIEAQWDESLFWIYLNLADMYLREGDVIHARPIMDALEATILAMNYRVENLMHLYFYRDKKALFEINAMEYGAAVRTMQATIDSMEAVFSALAMDSLIGSYFSGNSEPASEYLGDAYCMKVYAELFLQCTDPTLYDRSLLRDTERALSQYRFQGELERNQQYRSKAENGQGNCAEALKWLLATQCIDPEPDGLETACERYLRAAESEDALSRVYYLMYYVEIMENAARLGIQEVSTPMAAALVSRMDALKDIFEAFGSAAQTADLPKDTLVFRDIFSSAKPPRRYHPLEIVLWKYGSYHRHMGNVKQADLYWNAALSVCDENPDYTVLKLVAIAIQLERLANLLEAGGNVKTVMRNIDKRCQRVLDIGDDLPVPMREYVLQALDLLTLSDAKDAALRARALSWRIAY